MTTKEPDTTRKLISVAHRDLHAAATIYDILDALPDNERRRVLQWCNEKYPDNGVQNGSQLPVHSGR